MLRSLYAGISGLRAEQTMLDVTSNNIANVNTTGFKSSSVQFEDTLSQTLSAAGLPQPTKAGTNPNQVGLGVRVAAINTNLAQGEQQSTGNNLDTMISGDGYFVTTMGTQTQYTRDGAFHWDAQGRLASADGGLVEGWSAVGGVINTGGAPSADQPPVRLRRAGGRDDEGGRHRQPRLHGRGRPVGQGDQRLRRRRHAEDAVDHVHARRERRAGATRPATAPAPR